METVRHDEADSTRQLLGDFLEPLADHAAQLRALHHRGAHRHRTRTDAVFLIARQVHELTHARQRVREPRHRRPRQAAAIRYLEIAEPGFVALEASQHVERARHHLDDITLTGFASECTLPA
jgi:hypothetical protein